jgi:hypothetical protein
VTIRARLQSVENDLVALGKRNVIIECRAGVFTWVQRGAGREAAEKLGLSVTFREWIT